MKNIPIVIDFDGTIVEHAYPKIGAPVPGALETMKQYQKEGALLILFTMRSGKELNAAVEYCKENGVEFYGIQTNPSQSRWTDSPKAYGQLFIDDAAAGCPLIYPDGIVGGISRPYVNWVKIDEIVRFRLNN
jgi:hypothetical protein